MIDPAALYGKQFVDQENRKKSKGTQGSYSSAEEDK